jgi:N-acetylmuramoyl-L-alanine amidase
MATVVIDPGHGGSEKVGGSSPNNAAGPCGLLEKTVTLQVARAAREALRNADVSASLTRDRDVNLGLAARATVARKAKAAAFVSIHFNGWTDPRTQGTETYHDTLASEESRALARLLHERLVVATGLKSRGVKQERFGVIRTDRHDPFTAATLAEVSFMTDPAEEARLRDAAYISRLGEAVAMAVIDSLRARGLMPAAPTTRRGRRAPAGAVTDELEDAFAMRAAPALRTDRARRKRPQVRARR